MEDDNGLLRAFVDIDTGLIEDVDLSAWFTNAEAV